MTIEPGPFATRTEAMTPSAMELVERVQALHDSAATLDPVGWRARDDLSGIAGLDLPARTGGAAASATDMAETFRRLGRIDLELRDVAGAGHARILTHARTRRFDTLLADIARGSAFCAVAITEPGTGSDLHALETAARGGEDGFILSGVKQHVSRIEECTHLIVLAAVYRPHARITAFLVPKDAPGVTVEAMAPMGMSSVSWGRVRLDDVAIPREFRIGGEGEGISLFLRHFSYWRVMMAAAAVGSAQSAIDMAMERMKTREAFGGPIGRFSHLQLALAEHVASLRMAWLLVLDAAGRLDGRDTAITEAAMAKAEAVERAIRAVEWAMSVYGAAGYDRETGLEKRYRDLAGMRMADGTTDVLRGQVARSLLGDRLYEAGLGRDGDHEALNDIPRRLFW